jgi:hypothetical protein
MGKPGCKNPLWFRASVIAIDGPLLPEGAPHEFVATSNPFSLAPHSAIVVDPASVIMGSDWN